MGARALPAAMDRGAGRGPALGDERSSRRAHAVQRAPFAPPLDPCACRARRRANLGQKGLFAGTVCRAHKMQKEYWQISFYIHHSSVFKV